jgi:hypothetical protein
MSLTLLQNPEAKTADYSVMSGNLRVGRIYRHENVRRPEMEWLWALNGVFGGPKSMRITGMTATLDKAEAELKASWETWVAWAGLQDANPSPPPAEAAPAPAETSPDLSASST